MGLYTAQLYPGRGLGFMILGASLHDILTRIKAEPQTFPRIETFHSQNDPVIGPIMINLPLNGIRLRFDGSEQRLRLVEILDFTKNHVTFKDKDLVRPPSSSPIPGEPSSGPTFRHIYNRLLGPTYDGEYIPPENEGAVGTYILSYPGVGYSFALPTSAYSPGKDVVTLLSPGNQIASSMSVFSGDSWAQARETMWDEVLPAIKTIPPLSKGKDTTCPDEISLIKIHGAGKLQLFKNWSSTACTWVTLGQTTPQDLVAELGPPDAIYRKNDQRMYIHKPRASSGNLPRPELRPDELTDTDQSSALTSDDSHDDEVLEDAFTGNVSGECFFNYFYLGFDILLSNPITPSLVPPSQRSLQNPPLSNDEVSATMTNPSPDQLVATKIVIHSNVPGSYPFNRHRRCRWEISYLPPQSPPSLHNQPPDESDTDEDELPNSETPFPEIQTRLRDEWASVYGSIDEAEKQQRGMVLNRGWGDSPGSSIELLGGWEGDSSGTGSGGGASGGTRPSALRGADGGDESTSTLYGFPGLVFEVLRNGFVSALTVF